MVLRAFFVTLLCLGASSYAHADRKEEATAAADRGDRAFAKGAFAPALVEYQASYEKYPKPFLLFRIAECQRNLGKDAEALDTYKKYLLKVTKGSDRKKAQAWAAELQVKADLAAQAAVVPATPVSVPQSTDVEAPAMDAHEVAERDRKARLAQETTATAPKEEPLPPGIDNGPFPDPTLLHDKPPPDPKPPLPLHKRWWLWTAVVGGAAVLAGLGVVIYYERPRFRSELPIGGPGATGVLVHF